MESILPSKAYTSGEWFDEEKERLHMRLWQFITPRMLLSKPNSFVRRQINGIDVVIQNINGNICAFENVCVHRQSPIQCEHHGVRALVCPYHAWAYGEDGKVINIPKEKEAYRFTKSERDNLRLRTFHVFEFGQLIFINLNKAPIDFWAQFDKNSVQTLLDASMIFDDEVLVTSFYKNFNWKLAYENLRDSLHPQFVHAKTLYKEVKFATHLNEGEITEAKNYIINGSANTDDHLKKLRSFSGGGLDEPIEKKKSYQWHNYVSRYGENDWYLNWLMYPNLHVASANGGYSFIIEHHIPISESKTQIWVYYLTGRKKRAYSTSSAVLIAHIRGAEKVLSEDIQIMEKVQSSLYSNSPKSITGDYEHNNLTIEKWYLDVMQGVHAL